MLYTLTNIINHIIPNKNNNLSFLKQINLPKYQLIHGQMTNRTQVIMDQVSTNHTNSLSDIKLEEIQYLCKAIII